MLAAEKRRGRVARWVLWTLAFVVVSCAVLVSTSIVLVKGSLPILDGTLTAPGIGSKVSVVRDAQGVPTITGTSREDVAYATGFLHAQERFFQMDLMRRSATGELADLVGPPALPLDRERRLHQFGRRAAAALATMSSADRALLDGYVAGVNAGLAALKTRPFEYLVLRASPRPWRAEDSLLVAWSMYFELQGRQLHREFARGWLHDHADEAQLAALLPRATVWDAPLDADAVPAGEHGAPFEGHGPAWMGPSVSEAKTVVAEVDFGTTVGSSNWAIAGRRSADGVALVSSDMHLGLSLPNAWYRAVLLYPAEGSTRRVVGVTLPGSPLLIAGTNGQVAWGFTNSYGDYLDLIRLEIDPVHPSRYRTADGWKELQVHDETLTVNGGKAETLHVAETVWGPVWSRGGRSFAVRWVAHDPGAIDLGLFRMEGAHGVQDALAFGQGAGIPAQNLVVGDSAGHIGWTIAGAMPRRQAGAEVTFPYDGTDAAKGWTALAEPGDRPAVVDPASGQLWTANSRQLAGAAQWRIGDGGQDLGARARQIRDDLKELARVDESSAYAVSLDDRALYMSTWRDRALKALDDASVAGHPQRAEFRRLLREGWGGHASVDAVAYRLSRQYLYSLYAGLFGDVDRQLKDLDRDASFGVASTRWPEVIGHLLDTKPAGWLMARRADWHAVELAAIDDAIAKLTEHDVALKDANWGRKNTARIAHPFAASLPPLARWLAAPSDPLPGDGNMPRVAAPAFGQSERMIMSPGHEDRALFNMPGGEGGHPFSGYFLADHAAWVAGHAQPLLPGPQAHVLQLEPAAH